MSATVLALHPAAARPAPRRDARPHRTPPRSHRPVVDLGAVRTRGAARAAVPRPSAPRPARPLRARALPAARRATAPACSRPRLRITRRGRLLLTVTTGSLLAGVAAALLAGPSVAGTDAGRAPAVVTVLPGQTLSEIAGEWSPGADWRETAAEIAEVNDLTSQGVAAGQRLLLPAQG